MFVLLVFFLDLLWHKAPVLCGCRRRLPVGRQQATQGRRQLWRLRCVNSQPWKQSTWCMRGVLLGGFLDSKTPIHWHHLRRPLWWLKAKFPDFVLFNCHLL